MHNIFQSVNKMDILCLSGYKDIHSMSPRHFLWPFLPFLVHILSGLLLVFISSDQTISDDNISCSLKWFVTLPCDLVDCLPFSNHQY